LFILTVLIAAARGGRRTAEAASTMRESRSASNLFDLGGRTGIAGKSIESAGLRGLPDAFLVAIDRGATTLHAVAPSEVLQAGDVLWFAGSTEGVISLRKIPGVSMPPVVVRPLTSRGRLFLLFPRFQCFTMQAWPRLMIRLESLPHMCLTVD